MVPEVDREEVDVEGVSVVDVSDVDVKDILLSNARIKVKVKSVTTAAR